MSEDVSEVVKKQGESKFWMFTINNPLNNEFENMSNVEYMIWQMEMGENGTLHVQGYVCFFKKRTFTSVKASFFEYGEHRPHLENRRGKHSEAKGYCSKSDTRLDGPYVVGDDRDIPEGKGSRTDMIDIRNKIDNGVSEAILWQENFSSYTRYYKAFREYKNVQVVDKNKKVLKNDFSLSKITLRLWQKSTLEILELQDNRKILWVVDPTGNKGKTFLANYMIANLDTYYTRGGKGADIAHAYNYQKYVVFDYPREHEEFLNYSVIEQFKDGHLWSSKYDSQMKSMPTCKVLCLSNFMPDKRKMSKDRWVIKDLSD